MPCEHFEERDEAPSVGKFDAEASKAGNTVIGR
jgi:hypothetical protein